jgi:hypothetical protein
MTDNTANGKESSIGKINIDSGAQVKIDVPVNELEIAKTSSKASVTIDKLQCKIFEYHARYDNSIEYDGSAGDAILILDVSLPEGYLTDDSNEFWDMSIVIKVKIEIDQTDPG